MDIALRAYFCASPQEQQEIGTEASETLHNKMGMLNEDQLELLKMRYQEALSFDEIAKRKNYSHGTAFNKIQELLAFLHP